MFKKAIVIDTRDPLNEGRVKFRYIYNSSEEFPDDMLYWAEQMPIFPGYEDSGSFVVPPKGTIVAIFIEEADYFKPYYLGGWNNVTGRPAEAVNLKRRVLYKSETGATILVDDTQGKERIRIIDRLGQTIEMFSPTKEDVTKRGLGNVVDGGAKTLGDTPNQYATIAITGLAGVSIELLSSSEGSELNLISEGTVNIVGKKVTVNGGEYGVHTAYNHPFCQYTGAPLKGDPNFTAT